MNPHYFHLTTIFLTLYQRKSRRLCLRMTTDCCRNLSLPLPATCLGTCDIRLCCFSKHGNHLALGQLTQIPPEWKDVLFFAVRQAVLHHVPQHNQPFYMPIVPRLVPNGSRKAVHCILECIEKVSLNMNPSISQTNTDGHSC